MRKIEFRGKPKDKSACACAEDNGFVCGGIAFDGCTDETYITRWNSFGLGFIENIEVDPATVGQFTGLTDKNGDSIYEGDIVDYDTRHNLIVEFGNYDYFGWGLTYPNTRYYFHCLNQCDVRVLTVIGNIHDNPELIE